MSDLSALFAEQEKVARWKAESENASARYELALMRKNCAHLLSQHEPVAALGLDRERLRLALRYVMHGDLGRMNRDFEELRVSEARKAV